MATRHHDTQKRQQRCGRSSIISGHHQSRRAAAQRLFETATEIRAGLKRRLAITIRKTNQPGRERVKGLHRARPAPVSRRDWHMGFTDRGRERGGAVVALLHQRLVQLESKGRSECVPHLSRSYRSHRFRRYFSRCLPRRPLVKTRESAHRPRCRQGRHRSCPSQDRWRSHAPKIRSACPRF